MGNGISNQHASFEGSTTYVLLVNERPATVALDVALLHAWLCKDLNQCQSFIEMLHAKLLSMFDMRVDSCANPFLVTLQAIPRVRQGKSTCVMVQIFESPTHPNHDGIQLQIFV